MLRAQLAIPFRAAAWNAGSAPDESGDLLAREIRFAYGSVPTVSAPRGTARANCEHSSNENRRSLLAKPYTQEELLGALRSVGVPGKAPGVPAR